MKTGVETWMSEICCTGFVENERKENEEKEERQKATR